tara:strand:- start:1438 stop:1725 length:288 start_codon:yes stop_codon:yes gene_type:complete
MARKKQSKKEMTEKMEIRRSENEFQMSQELERLIKSFARRGIPFSHSVEVMIDFTVNFAFSVHPTPMEANHEIMKSVTRELLHQGEIKESELKLN